MLEMKDLIAKFFNEISKDIKAEALAQGRTASGRTAQSLEIEADNRTGILSGFTSALTWETGRKSGKTPGGFQKIIEQWMSDKGLFQAETDSKKRSIAFLIARKIRESGTLLHRQGGQSGVLSNIITDERISVFESEVLRRVGREVLDDMVVAFK